MPMWWEDLWVLVGILALSLEVIFPFVAVVFLVIHHMGNQDGLSYIVDERDDPILISAYVKDGGRAFGVRVASDVGLAE